MTRDKNEVSKSAVYISFTHSRSLEIVLTAVAVAVEVVKERSGCAKSAGQSDRLSGTQIF